MLAACLIAVLASVASAGGEVAALRSALGAADPDPEQVAGVMPAVVEAADPEVVPLFIKEYDRYRRQLRDQEETVAGVQSVLEYLEELSAKLGEGRGINPDLVEDQKLKLRKNESKRATSEKVVSALDEWVVKVFDAVAASGDPKAFDLLLDAFERETARTTEVDDEDEKTKGALAQVEFELRRMQKEAEDDPNVLVSVLEERAKLNRRLDMIEAELKGHGKVRGAVLSGVSGLMAAMSATDQKKAVKEIKSKVDKRRPPTERALYMDMFAGLGQAKGPDDIQKLYQSTWKEIGRIDADLGKLRKRYEKVLEGYFGMLKHSDGMIRVDLKEALEAVTKELQEMSAYREEVDRLRSAAALALGLSVASLPDGGEKERKVTWLIGQAQKEKVPENRALIVKSLARCDTPEVRTAVVERAEGDKDARVRVACLDTIVELELREALGMVQNSMLKDKDWRIRAAAVAALARLPDNSSIPVLIEALGAESGRLQEDITNALRQLTGQGFAMSAAVWQRWWDDNAQGFDVEAVQRERRLALGGDEDEDKKGVTFYGISSPSSKIVFVLDVSGSMKEPVEGRRDRRKIDVAVEELKNAVAGLNDGDTFSIVLFAENVQRWQEKMMKVSTKVKGRANKWIDETVEAFGGTNIHGGMMEAFKIAGMGTRDAKYEPAVDTIFLLSDGDPTLGEVVDPDQLRILLREHNALSRVRVHTIGVGHGANVGFLYGLAEDSGGLFVKR